MLFAQILNDDLGCASYLVGCEEAGIAVVVDPPYAIEAVLDEAARLDVRVVRTIETHTHADHVSGHGRLALEHGIPVSIHPEARVDYASDPLEDGADDRGGDRHAPVHPHAGTSSRALLSRRRSIRRAPTSRGSS